MNAEERLKRPLLGQLGEMLAAEYLRVKKGYTILERNYRCTCGEIDIVADDGGALVFVEVRTKENDFFGHPLESIDFKKQGKLRQVARFYLSERHVWRDTVRFDAVGILLAEGEEPVFDLVQNAVVW